MNSIKNAFLSLLFFCCALASAAQNGQREKIIIDTDIGDDIDDAFAVALALRSPELQILGISTTFGDTETRAKLVDRMLGEAGREDIPVAVGIHTETKTNFGQRPYADGGQRFWGATFDPSGLYRFIAAMDWLDATRTTIEDVHRHSTRLQKHFLDLVRQLARQMLSPA